MRNARVWRALLDVEKTIAEELEYDDDEDVLVAGCDHRPVCGAGAASASGAARAMTAGRAGGGGGVWAWARSGRC